MKSKKIFSSIPVALVSVDYEGNFVQMNELALRLLNIIHFKKLSLFDFIEHSLHKDFTEFLNNAFKSNSIQNKEFIIHTKDKQTKHCLFQTNTTFQTDEGKEFCNIVFIELADYIERENKLKVSEENYRLLIEESGDPIFSFTQDGQYIYVNKAFAAGVGKEQNQIIGKKIWDVFPKVEADKRFAVVKYVFESGIPKIFEVKVPTKHGDTFYITSVTPIKNEDGKVKIAICISKNITSRRNAEDALKISEQSLREANLTKDKLLSIVAHDLRSPFNILIGLTSLIIDSYKRYTDDEKLTYLKYINEEAQQTYIMLENLLDWARMQRNSISLNRTKATLVNLFDAIYHQTSKLAANKSITLNIAYPETLELYLDFDLLQTVIRNLVVNAIKFTPEKGTITIEAQVTCKTLQLKVTDTGIGIVKEKIPHLFKVETNFTTTGTNNERGTGLGLVLCKEFVEIQGGNISVSSIPKEGSCFTILLPLVDE